MQSQIERQFRLLSEPAPDVDQIRLNIANLIATEIENSRDSFGPWERLHFAQAIAYFHTNISSGDPSFTIWLRACLFAVEKALVPPEQRSPQYPVREEEVEAFTFEVLSTAIRKLGGHAG